jgi:hypothetical protein
MVTISNRLSKGAAIWFINRLRWAVVFSQGSQQDGEICLNLLHLDDQGAEKTIMIFKGAHVAAAMILTSVRWPVAHPLSDCSIGVYGSTATGCPMWEC